MKNFTKDEFNKNSTKEALKLICKHFNVGVKQA